MDQAPLLRFMCGCEIVHGFLWSKVSKIGTFAFAMSLHVQYVHTSPGAGARNRPGERTWSSIKLIAI